MATSVPPSNASSDGEDSRQSWDLINNPICLATISKRKSAFLPYKPHPPNNTASNSSIVAVTASVATTTGHINSNIHHHSSSTATTPTLGSNSGVLTNLQRGNTEAHVSGGHIALSFHERCGQGEVTAEQVLHERHHGGLLDAPDAVCQFTPLHWASHYGQLHTVQLLLQHGANANRLAPDHVSALLLAAAGGHHDVVRCLLRHDADAQHTDIVGNTALMYAAAGNHPHTTNELLAAARPNIMATNEHGDSAYSLAVQNRAALSQAVLEKYLVSMLAPGNC